MKRDEAEADLKSRPDIPNEEVEALIRRAIDLEAVDASAEDDAADVMSVETVLALGEELNIDRRYIEAAIAERLAAARDDDGGPPDDTTESARRTLVSRLPWVCLTLCIIALASLILMPDRTFPIHLFRPLPASFKFMDGVLLVNGAADLWTKDIAYDVTDGRTVHVEARFRLAGPAAKGKDRGAGLRIGFSKNLRPWGSRDEDALTLRLYHSPEWPAAIRTEMYRKFVKTGPFRPKLGVWLNLKVTLTASRFIARVDDEVVIDADLDGHVFPHRGYFGLLGYSDSVFEVSWLHITQNEALVDER